MLFYSSIIKTQQALRLIRKKEQSLKIPAKQQKLVDYTAVIPLPSGCFQKAANSTFK
jgi:hypothetical protein